MSKTHTATRAVTGFRTLYPGDPQNENPTVTDEQLAEFVANIEGIIWRQGRENNTIQRW